jgi:uncharacterized membrane protein YcaP (DUF421 family)
VDPLRLIVRVVVAYVVMLVLIRWTGKRTIRHGNTLEFTIALVVGDLVDDMVWAEVAASQFLVAASVLTVAHVVLDLARYRAGLAR